MTAALAASRPGREAAPTARPDGFVSVVHEGRAMGGRLVIRVTTQPARAGEARRDAAIAARRVVAWASLLTRHDPGSDLMRLNADARREVPVGPTLAEALAWAADASARTGGIVDPTLLAQRLAAEGADETAAATGAPADPPVADHGWTLSPLPDARGRGAIVSRGRGVRFDLDGVAKGWLADRALGLLERHPGAIVDADGDIALRLAPGEHVEVGVDDPRTTGGHLAILALEAPWTRRATWGVATSGTSVHQWPSAAGTAHHLVDPRTGRPAVTDVVQATVLAADARSAEALAKTAVILGSVRALDVLEPAGSAAAVLLLADGRVLATPSTTRFLA